MCHDRPRGCCEHISPTEYENSDNCSRLLKNTKREWKDELLQTKLYFTSVFGDILNLQRLCTMTPKTRNKSIFITFSSKSVVVLFYIKKFNFPHHSPLGKCKLKPLSLHTCRQGCHKKWWHCRVPAGTQRRCVSQTRLEGVGNGPAAPAAASVKTKQTDPIETSAQTWAFSSVSWELVFPQKPVEECLSSFLCDSQKSEIAPLFLNQWMIIHSMKYPASVERNKVLVHAPTWMRLHRNVSGKRQSQNVRYYVILFLYPP